MGLCPVCWWEDDGQEDADASDVRLTVNGQLSLDEAVPPKWITPVLQNLWPLRL